MLQGRPEGSCQQREAHEGFRHGLTATVILDIGPWVAMHCRDERHHGWAIEQFAQHAGPFITCESVVTETCFLLAHAGFVPAKALALVERGVVRIAMVLGEAS